MKKVSLFMLLFGCAVMTYSQHLVDLYQKVNSSVVVIETMNTVSVGHGDKQKVATEGGQGSGVLISKDGLIWTASHVVHNAEFVAVKFTDDDIYKATVISTNPVADVALLKIESGFELREKHVAKIANSDHVKIGEDIFVIGAPHGIEQTLSKGIVSGRLSPHNKAHDFMQVEYIQTDAAINPGNSGGPMFNMKGEVIGIASFILSESGGFDGIGFGATSNIAQKILMEEKTIWTGMEYAYLVDEMADAFNLPQKGGLLILTVSSEGLGAKLGLRGGYVKAEIEGVEMLIGGDVILEVAGIKLDRAASLLTVRKKILSLEKDEKYSIQYLRSGKIRTTVAVSP